jgi:hypothetical protein
LCKEETEIVVQELRESPMSLGRIALSKKNAGAACPQPTFLFDRDAAAIIARTGSVKVATVSMLIQHAPPDPAYPYLCRFYWDDLSNQWLPMDMCFLWVNTSGLKRVTDF